MSTFSENFIQIIQVWPQLQPKTWSEAILRIYKSLHHFIIDSLQKCILEAVINCLEIQSWLKGEIVPNWMSSLSKAASKMHFWRLSMIKWCKLVYILRMASGHVLGYSWGLNWSIWMKFEYARTKFWGSRWTRHRLKKTTKWEKVRLLIFFKNVDEIIIEFRP